MPTALLLRIYLPPIGAFPKLYFRRFPFRPPCRRFRLAPSHKRALPKLFPTVSSPSIVSSLPHRSFSTELSPGYFLRFPLRPPCRRFPLAPSHQSSPQGIISHGFLSVVASASLLLNGALPKLFPPVSTPSTPSQRSSPQAISHGFSSVHPLVASVSLPSRQSQLNENPSIGDAFRNKCKPLTVIDRAASRTAPNSCMLKKSAFSLQ